MTTLTIEQGNNIEIVSNAVIQKLYETVLDSTNVTLSGNLQCEHCYEDVYNYLTGYITEGVKRFPNLAINVTGGTYIRFADPEVERVLLSLTGNDAISSDGIGITQTDAAVPTKTPQNLFNNNTTITSFNELGKFTNLKWLLTQAFSSATNLTSVDLSNIERIDFMAFSDTKLTGVVNLPSIVTFGGRHAFTRCNYITEVNIGPNFTGFNNVSTFEGCTALTKVTGLNNLTEIPASTFEGCTALSDIDVDWNKITKLNDDVFYGCNSLVITDLSIPNLTDLGANTFKSTNVKKVSDLGTISIVKGSTFKTCTLLTLVALPLTCVKLDNQCFYGCTNLTSVSLSGILYIGEGVFEYSGLTGSIVLPNTLLRVRYNAFNNTNITSITYPATLTQTYDGESEIDSSTGLKRIGIPLSTTLQTVTFEQGFNIPVIYIINNKQVSMTVPDTVRFITGFVDRMDSTSLLTFSNNSNIEFIGRDGNSGRYKDFDFTIDHTLAEYQALCNTGYSSPFRLVFNNFPKNNIKYLPRNFLEGVNINDMRDIIGSNIVVIGKSCFLKYDMTSLNYSVTLPTSLKFVGANAFKKNAPISWIFEGTTPPIFENTYGLFSDGGNSASSYSVPIYVPASAVSAYQAAIPEYAHCIQANPNS